MVASIPDSFRVRSALSSAPASIVVVVVMTGPSLPGGQRPGGRLMW